MLHESLLKNGCLRQLNKMFLIELMRNLLLQSLCVVGYSSDRYAISFLEIDKLVENFIRVNAKSQ